MIKYRKFSIATNSYAYELYQEAQKKGDYKPLDKHLKQLETAEKELLKRYEYLEKKPALGMYRGPVRHYLNSKHGVRVSVDKSLCR